MKRDGISLHVYQNDHWLVDLDENEPPRANKESTFIPKQCQAKNAPTEGILKVFFTHAYRDHEVLTEIESEINQKYGDQLSVAFSTPNCLEVMGEGVSKGHALQMLAESMELKLENCIAFGDGMNDVEMLSMAGKGLVMETSHEKVIAALPQIEVIGSNADDSVARYLKEHLLSSK